MKGLILKTHDAWPEWAEIAPPGSNRPGEVIVELMASALNRRDYYICKGLYPNVKLPIILGSDGVGMYKEQRVLLNPGLNWPVKTEVQPNDFEVLGMPKHGTFAQAIAIQEKYIRPCPEHLTLEEAAALPLAGMTAYRALFSKARINKEDKILITGIGGGVALMALQFALANGNEVCVTSGSSVKLQRAIEMGATIGIDYNSTDWEKAIVKQSGGLFDVIIDSAGGSSFNKLVKCTAPGGRIVVYGGTRGKWTDISPQLLFWRQIAILGTTMSSAEEFDDMLQFVTKNQIRPIVDRVMSLDQGAEALQSMKNSEQFGKIVLLH